MRSRQLARIASSAGATSRSPPLRRSLASRAGEAAQSKETGISVAPLVLGLAAAVGGAVTADAFYGSDRLGVASALRGTGGEAPLKGPTAEELAAKAEARERQFAKAEAARKQKAAEEEARKAAEAKALAEAADAAASAAAEAEVRLQSALEALRAAVDEGKLAKAAATGCDAVGRTSLAAQEALDQTSAALAAEAAAAARAGLAEDSEEAAEASAEESPRDLISSGRGLAAEIEEAAAAGEKWREARLLLRSNQSKADLKEIDVASLGAAIHALEAAENILSSLGVDVAGISGFEAGDASLVHDAQSKIAEILACRKREEAHSKLEESLAARTKGPVEAQLKALEDVAVALAEAKDAGVTACDAMSLAELLTSRPEQLSELLGAEVSANGLSVSDFSRAATASASMMDEQQLREESAMLAASLARLRSLHAGDLQNKLASAKEQLLERCADRTDKEMEKLRGRIAEALSQRKTSAEEASKAELETAIAEVRSVLASFVHEKTEELRNTADSRVAASVASLSEELRNRLDALQNPWMQLEAVREAGQSPQQRSQVNTSLAALLLTLEAAVREGRSPAEELTAMRQVTSMTDGFLPRLLETLPADVASRDPIRIEPELRRSFAEHLNELASAALAPPSDGGLLARVGANLAGHILARLYTLKPASVPEAASHGASTEAARLNLASLAKAAERVDCGDIRGALAAMEALTGQCKLQSSRWVAEARRALLLQQTLRAVQAKARCLNSAML
mmetsp:Transcript_22634/g.40902  ORF Transcript_22634/g.40902 Transcript_22634/m.40902 type:complete len:747 (+) Transcript_22634:53-2293(+)